MIPFNYLVITCPSEEKEHVYVQQLEEQAQVLGLENCTIIAVSDPVGVRIGSGGGSLNALERLRSVIGAAALQEAKVLIIHSGGDSRRAPQHSVTGKAWASINTEDITSPLALLIKECVRFFTNLPPASFVVASSDVMLDLDPNSCTPLDIPENAVSVVAVPELPEVAKNHGVLVTRREGPTSASPHVAPAALYVQKPCLETMQEVGAVGALGKCLIDTGLVVATGGAYHAFLAFLDDPTVSRCTQRGMKASKSSGSNCNQGSRIEPIRLELYSDMLLAVALEAGPCSLEEYSCRLGLRDPCLLDGKEEEGSLREALVRVWKGLSVLPLFVLACPQGSFMHLGTTSEMLDMVSYPGKGDKSSATKYAQFYRKYGLQTMCASCVSDENKAAVYMNSVLASSTLPSQGGTRSSQGAGGGDGYVEVEGDAKSMSMVEHSVLSLAGATPGGNIVSHVGPLLQLGTVRPHIMLQQVPMGESDGGGRKMAVTVLGTSDPIKVPYNDSSGRATVCGVPWDLFFAVTGWTPKDVWRDPLAETAGLWSAKLFCVSVERYDCALGGRIDLNTKGGAEELEKGAAAMKSEVSCLVLTWMQHLQWYHKHLLSHTDTSSSKASKLSHFCTSLSQIGYGGGLTADDVQTALRVYVTTPLSCRVSLADLLAEGDAEYMYTWRTLLRSSIVPLIFPLHRALESASLPQHGVEDRGETRLARERRDGLLHILPHIAHQYSLISKQVGGEGHCEWLLLWCVRLCLGFTWSGLSGVTAAATEGEIALCKPSAPELMSMIPSTEDGGQRVMLGALRAYRGPAAAVSALLGSQPSQEETEASRRRVKLLCAFWESIVGSMRPSTGTGRVGDSALLVLHFLRRLAIFNSSSSAVGATLIRMITALLAIAPHVSPESHPRLLMLCAWLVRPSEPEKEKEASDHKDLGRFDLVSIVTMRALDAPVAGSDLGGLQCGLTVCSLVARALTSSGQQLPSGHVLARQLESCAQLITGRHLHASLLLRLSEEMEASQRPNTDKDKEGESTSAATTKKKPCPNELCLCMDCTCGEGCTCNKGPDVVCDPCSDFKKVMMAKKMRRHAHVVAQAPVRVDLAGGWSDTPPICYENPLGGSVLNVGVRVDGRKPVVCCCRITSVDGRNGANDAPPPPHFVLRSLQVRKRDSESGEVSLEGPTDSVVSLVDFTSARDPTRRDPHALLKACCIALGLVPDTSSTGIGTPTHSSGHSPEMSVSSHLRALFGANIGSLEVSCVSDLPAGSGMGGSSVLAATVVAALLRLLTRTGVATTATANAPRNGLHNDTEEPSPSLVVYYTSLVEQILTTGGGWQDQCGALPGGFKLSRSSGSLPLSISAKVIAPPPEQQRAFLDEFHRRAFLVYTGVTRLARDTLMCALRSFAYQPLEHACDQGNDNYRQGTIGRLRRGAESAAQELHSSDPSLTAETRVDQLAVHINEYWALKKEMASGSEPPHIAALISYLCPYSSGLSLCGAGAGGFAFVLLKADIVNSSPAGGEVLLKGLMQAYDPEMTVHSMTVDESGLSTRVIEAEAGMSPCHVLAASLR